MEQHINTIYPGTTCSIPQPLKKHKKIIIKNINHNIIAKALTNIIKESTQEKVTLRDFTPHKIINRFHFLLNLQRYSL